MAVALAICLSTVTVMPLASASSGNIAQYSGVYITTVNPSQPNVTLALQPGNGSFVLPDWTFWIYGNTTYKIYVDGAMVQEGYNVGTGTFHDSLGAGIHNVTVIIGSTTYRYNNVSVIGSIATHPYQNVYIESWYPGVSQQLLVYANQTGIVTYAHMKVTMISSSNVPYKVYVDGQFYTSGNLTTTTYVVPLFENLTSVSIDVELGGHLYNFNNMPIARIPLQQKKTNPQAVPIYTQLEQDIFSVKLLISSIMSFAVSILIVGSVGLQYIDTRIKG